MLSRLAKDSHESGFDEDQNQRPGARVEQSSVQQQQRTLADFWEKIPAPLSGAKKKSRKRSAPVHNDEDQGSFLSALGAATANAERQRHLQQTSQLVEQNLMMAEGRYQPPQYSAPDYGVHPNHAQQAPLQPQMPYGEQANYQAPTNQTAPYQPTTPYNPRASEGGPAQSVEQQLDLLNDQLVNVRSRFQQDGDAAYSAQPNHQSHSGHYSDPMDYSTDDEYDDNPFAFDKITSAVLRSWKWIFMGGVAGGVIAAVYAMSLPNRYEAIAEILIEPRSLKIFDNRVTPDGLNSEATVAYAESQLSIIRSLSVIDPVIDDLKLDENPEFNGQGESGGLFSFLKSFSPTDTAAKNRRDLARLYLRENMWVARMAQTFEIKIGMVSLDPETSREVANALAKSYIEDESATQSSAASKASEDLTKQLPALRKLVEESAQKVESHKREHNLVSLGDQFANQAQMARLTDQVAIAKVQTGDARVRAEIAAKADLSDVVSGSLPSSIVTPALKQLRSQYAQVQAANKGLAVNLGNRHPKLIAAQAQLGGIRNSIRSEVERIISSAKAEYQRAKARETELNKQIVAQESLLSDDSGAMVALREYERQLDANRKLYETFLLRARETSEQEKVRSESASVISPAILPLRKKDPNRKAIVMTGGILGAGLLGFLALIPFAWGGMQQTMAGARRKRRGPQGYQAMPPMPPMQPMQQSGEGDLYSSGQNQAPNGTPIYSDWDRRG